MTKFHMRAKVFTYIHYL